jgi:hypothetical protein
LSKSRQIAIQLLEGLGARRNTARMENLLKGQSREIGQPSRCDNWQEAFGHQVDCQLDAKIV